MRLLFLNAGPRFAGTRFIGGCVLFLAALVMVPAYAFAEDVVYQKHQVVDFGDDTIDGNLSSPDGQYLESRKRLKHQRLIKVRESFRTEILQSVRVL